MTAQDYLIALKVIREIQRKQVYTSGRCDPSLVKACDAIEMYCPLDFSNTGARLVKSDLLRAYNGVLFK